MADDGSTTTAVVTAPPVRVDPAIVEAIANANMKVMGDSPIVAVSVVYQSLATAISICLQNAAVNQQNIINIANASTGVITQKITAMA
ncbi:RebB family R body protein [Oleisolibacter albus]|uniref:RebB family R body protein n=1 Tax=Oleisolibacter albus TaxID=2171757 RepID=UPI000DF3E46C|nr:RebB family R body protein [Oleisolibacter albus]